MEICHVNLGFYLTYNERLNSGIELSGLLKIDSRLAAKTNILQSAAVTRSSTTNYGTSWRRLCLQR